ncbi:hypothetical protein EJ04DRAFT_517290 [Polyplosphaeria fusca]|uniref:Uncharacterized protein n=1 Tax=Polyplosphaeria fusca TaxID=682080 RepID=A0A9P4UW20_9PLEO|nr:hypothetical protein EJ04DRAFT_517290 [Polyplosphaeria fusca]
MSTNYSQISNDALALGLTALLTAYIGAELAPTSLIERMLWPQRFSTGIDNGSIKNALFLSSGGPLHKVVIKAIETFYNHGLHKGSGRGHLLGTAFFPDTGIPYTVHSNNGKPAEDELVRNGLVVRILKCMSDTSALTKLSESNSRMRQQITVSHLQLFNFDNVPPQKPIALDAAEIDSQTILALLVSELPTFVLAGIVGYLWSMVGGALYLAPAALKIIAACTAMQREDLVIPADEEKQTWQTSTEISKFEIHIPGEGFQVISGPADLILPFFRHYGHPTRCRWRELTQMAIVAATGFIYPITLVLTMIFMPVNIQALWVGYQVYLLFAMVLARFGGGELWGSTEERVARALLETEKRRENKVVVLKNWTGEMMGAKLTRTLHGSYSDGKAQVARLVNQ